MQHSPGRLGHPGGPARGRARRRALARRSGPRPGARFAEGREDGQIRRSVRPARSRQRDLLGLGPTCPAARSSGPARFSGQSGCPPSCRTAPRAANSCRSMSPQQLCPRSLARRAASGVDMVAQPQVDQREACSFHLALSALPLVRKALARPLRAVAPSPSAVQGPKRPGGAAPRPEDPSPLRQVSSNAARAAFGSAVAPISAQPPCEPVDCGPPELPRIEAAPADRDQRSAAQHWRLATSTADSAVRARSQRRFRPDLRPRPCRPPSPALVDLRCSGFARVRGSP